MKSVRFYIGIVLVIAALLPAVAAEEAQQPFVDDVAIAIEDLPLEEDIIPDYILDDPDKEPVPPPIWSLCGNPSKHLLIPYPCS